MSREPQHSDPRVSKSMAARGKIGGLTTQFLHGRHEVAKRARDGKRAKLEREIRLRKPDLSDDELETELDRAVKIQMARKCSDLE